MKVMQLVTVAWLVLTGHAVHSSVACEPSPPLCESAARADVVFFGEVLEQTTYSEYMGRGGEPSPQGVQSVHFNVIRAFKGVKPAQWWGFFYFNSEARSFEKGARYLVLGHRSQSGAFHHGCTPTREMDKADEESWLRTGAVELDTCFKRRR